MDFTIPITGGSVAVAIAVVIWWFARERMTEAMRKREVLEGVLTSHIALCNEKNISHARLEEKVIRIDEKLDDVNKKIDRLTNMVMTVNKN